MSTPAPDTPGRPPNVLFIICDDLAFGDLACHGNPHIRTPHLDALHGQATRLTRYCSGPLCTPARASVMTGRYPYRTGAIDTYLGRSMMHGDEVTLAQVLRDAGYATCLSGKWHLGDTYPMRPHDQGFDEALYHLGGGLGQPANHDWPQSSYHDPLLMHNGQLEKVRGYCSDIFTDHALEFIEQHRDRPWFTYLAYNAPHTPLQVEDHWVQPYLDKGLNETFARLYGMVENIDHNVGRALARLDELGLTDDTIVVFTSDHGPCGSANHNDECRFNAGLRAQKGTVYDGGLRVPCFVRYPRGMAQGVDMDRVANPIDWLPTFASLCGGSVPGDRTIDGIDLAPLLTGVAEADDAWPDRAVVIQWHRGDIPEQGRNCAVITQRYKWARAAPAKDAYDPAQYPEQLFDLQADPLEQHDLAGDMPERCAELHGVYEAWFEDVSTTRGDTPEDNYAPPRIVVGSPHENPTVLTQQDWRTLSGERWRDETATGYWLIEAATAGRYDLGARFRARQRDDEVLHIDVGDERLTQPLTSGQDAHVFAGVELPAGPLRLDAYVMRGDDRLAVHFTDVQKHPA